MDNLLSYIRPRVINTYKGDITSLLKVVRCKGKYELRSQNTVYSYGKSNKILAEVFSFLELEKLAVQKILILGLGAGGILDLLNSKYKVSASILGIDNDQIVIDIALDFFNVDQYSNLKIVKKDAFDYVKDNTENFDLIISNLYNDLIVPYRFTEIEYFNHLKKRCSKKAIVIYSYIVNNALSKHEYEKISNRFKSIFPNVTELSIQNNELQYQIIISNSYI